MPTDGIAKTVVPQNFTIRAVLFGLFGAMVVCAVAYMNDYGIGGKQSTFIGNHLPVSIFSGLFLILVVVNPILHSLNRSVTAYTALTVISLLGFSFLSWLMNSTWPVAAAAIVAVAAGLVRKNFTQIPLRGLYLGSLGLIACAAFAYCIDEWWIVGVYALVAVLVACSWKFLGRQPCDPFSAGELVILLVLSLTAGSLPSSGLMRYFPQILVQPDVKGLLVLDWTTTQPKDYVKRKDLFPTREFENDRVYDSFFGGIGNKEIKDLPTIKKVLKESESPLRKWCLLAKNMLIQDARVIPWGGWVAPLMAWFPLLIFGFIFIICMCRIVHRQWSSHEQLAYPIAEFGNTLLERKPNHSFSTVFHNRIFWIGFGAVFAFHLLNGAQKYEPKLISIDLSWNFSGIFWSQLSFLTHSAGFKNAIFSGKIFLAVVAFAFFLPEDVSFSLGISHLVFGVLTALTFSAGHIVTPIEHQSQMFGSFMAMALVIVYTGRYYYMAVLKQAFCIRNKEKIDQGTVWACRWFLISAAFMMAIMCSFGLDWVLALLFTVGFATLFLVLARTSVETGLLFMQSNWVPHKIMIYFFGPAAIGPQPLYILFLLGVVLTQDTRECLSGFVSNSFRMADKNNVGTTGLSRTMLVTLSVGLFVAFAGVLWVIYDQGGNTDNYGGDSVPKNLVTDVSSAISKLQRTGQLDGSMEIHGLERFTSVLRDTNPEFMMAAIIGLVLVLINSTMRLRYVWWPVHSVMFLFWGTWALSNFVWSFLLGWVIKISVIRFGGGRVFQSIKPFFIGIIVGDLIGAAFFMAVATIRYLWFGEMPPEYKVFPG